MGKNKLDLKPFWVFGSGKVIIHILKRPQISHFDPYPDMYEQPNTTQFKPEFLVFLILGWARGFPPKKVTNFLKNF